MCPGYMKGMSVPSPAAHSFVGEGSGGHFENSGQANAAEIKETGNPYSSPRYTQESRRSSKISLDYYGPDSGREIEYRWTAAPIGAIIFDLFGTLKRRLGAALIGMVIVGAIYFVISGFRRKVTSKKRVNWHCGEQTNRVNFSFLKSTHGGANVATSRIENDSDNYF